MHENIFLKSLPVLIPCCIFPVHFQLEDIGSSERDDAQRCRARLARLSEAGSAEKDGFIQWSRGRIDRLLVDQMLRSGYYSAASQLVESSNLHNLTDMHIFIGARAVTEGLERHDCSEALAWCEKNKTRLKKVKSQLEFKLRVQVNTWIQLLSTSFNSASE